MSNFIATTRQSKNLFNMFATTGITVINANTFTVKVAAANSSGQTMSTLSILIPSLQVGDTIYVNYDCDYDDWEELRFGITTKAPKNTPITVTQYMLDNPIRFYRKTSGTNVDIEIKNLIITKDSNTSYEPFGYVTGKHIIRIIKSAVPNEYTQLEYIESTGAQWIDTGYIPTENTSVDLKWLSTDISGMQAVIGCDWMGNAMLLNIQGNRWWLHGSGAATITPSLSKPDIISYSAAAASFVVNGVSCNNAKDTLENAKTSMKIFGVNRRDYNYNAKGKLYYLNIYEGDTLVREYIPVRRNTDNTVGLYDNITKSFFTDMSSNNFTAGNDIVSNIIKCLVGGK